MIPRSLSDWTYRRVKDLADKAYLETDTFEFKPEIKSRNPKLNDRIRETSCAFANTSGGFIIFGVVDMGNKKKDRVTGIQESDDLAKEFGDKLREIEPVPYSDFKNPPPRVPSTGKVLFVVEIPQSNERPHMFNGRFYQRTNKGNEIMTIQQVKESILRYEERRHKLKLLYIEVFSNSIIAQEMIESSNKRIAYNPVIGESFLRYSPLKFEVAVISSILPDVFSIIQEDNEMIDLLLTLRLQLGTFNSEIAIFHSLEPEGMHFQSQTHNDYVRKNLGEYTMPLMEKIMKKMESKYDLINPFPDRKFEIFKKI